MSCNFGVGGVNATEAVKFGLIVALESAIEDINRVVTLLGRALKLILEAPKTQWLHEA